MSQPDTPRTVPDEEPTIGRLVADATRDLSTLVRSEIALAKSELRVSVKSGATGAGLLVGVAVLLLFVITMLSMAGAYFFAWVFDREISLAYVWGFLLMTAVWIVVIAIFALVGIRFLKKVKAPEKTIATAKEIPAALKGQTDTTTPAVTSTATAKHKS